MHYKVVKTLLCALSFYTYAADSICPKTEFIKAVGLEYVSLAGGTWSGYIFNNHFGTDKEWSFAIYGFDAEDKSDALKKGNELLNHMKLIDDKNCIYWKEDDSQIFAIASLN